MAKLYQSAGDLLQTPYPEKTYFLYPLIFAKCLGMIHAMTGVGKTWLALWLAIAAACGQDFLCWKGKRKAKILYIDGEMTNSVIAKRTEEIIKLGCYNPDAEDLFFICPDNFKEHMCPNLGTAEGRLIYNGIINETKADIIILDNLSTLLRRSGRETDEAAWARLIPWLLELRAADKCCIVIHHSGKSGQQLGTSTKEFQLDWTINLSRPMDYETKQGAKFGIKFEKNRFDDEERKFADPISVWLTKNESGFNWLWLPTSTDFKSTIKKMVDVGMTANQIAEINSMSLFFIKKTLKELKNENSEIDWSKGTEE